MDDFKVDDSAENVGCFNFTVEKWPFSLYITRMADFEVDIEVRCLKFLFGKVLELRVNLPLIM